MKSVMIFAAGLLIGLTYNNLAAKMFSPETNKVVEKVQNFKAKDTTFLE